MITCGIDIAVVVGRRSITCRRWPTSTRSYLWTAQPSRLLSTCSCSMHSTPTLPLSVCHDTCHSQWNYLCVCLSFMSLVVHLWS